MTNHFDGKGFDKDDFTPEERAEIRHAHKELRTAWPQILTFVQVWRGMRSMVLIFTTLAVLGGGLGWMAKQGWF